MSTIINGIGRVGIRVAPTSGGGGYTTRTAAFATATGIADTTILNALNTFDTGLISNGLDTKMKALYPFVGGTATTHKFNFMDARDLNAAFRLQFNGGWIHSSTGVLPNGANAYANTFLAPNLYTTISNASAGAYSRTDSAGGALLSSLYGDYTGIEILPKNSGIYFGANNYIANGYNSATIDTRGFFHTNKNSATLSTLYKNGTILSSASNPSNGVSSEYLVFSARNIGGGITLFSNRELSFGFVGNGMTNTESTTFYNLVQAFQTSLSRQV